MKMYWKSGGIAPCLLNLGARWRCVIRFMPWLPYPWGKSCWYPLGRKLGGPHSWCGCGGEEKNSHQCHCCELNPGSPACSLVSILTEILGLPSATPCSENC